MTGGFLGSLTPLKGSHIVPFHLGKNSLSGLRQKLHQNL
jgi:hypothetical protein